MPMPQREYVQFASVTTGSAHGFTGRPAMARAVPTLRYAAKAPRGEVRMYPEGHFEIYVDFEPT